MEKGFVASPNLLSKGQCRRSRLVRCRQLEAPSRARGHVLILLAWKPLLEPAQRASHLLGPAPDRRKCDGVGELGDDRTAKASTAGRRALGLAGGSDPAQV